MGFGLRVKIRPHPPSPSPCFLLHTARSRNDGEGAVLHCHSKQSNLHIIFISLISICEVDHVISIYDKGGQ